MPDLRTQFFRADLPYCCRSCSRCGHFLAGLHQDDTLKSAFLGNPQRPLSVPGANIQKRFAACGYTRNDDLLDAAQITFAATTEVSVVRRQEVVSRDWIVKMLSACQRIISRTARGL